MKPEEVNNRKEAIIYFLQILKEKNGPIDLGEFFFNSGYTRGIESFERMMEEMQTKGWIIISRTPSGSVPGMPYLRTNKVTYEISLDGLEYLENYTNNGKVLSNWKFLKKVSAKSKKIIGQIVIGLVITIVGGLILQSLITPNNNEAIKSRNQITKPLVYLEKYKIKAQNITYPTFDTLKINFQYQGSTVIIKDDFRIIGYNFQESYLFYKNEEYNDKPEIRLLEVINSNVILDSLHPKNNLLLEVQRKMIFDGNYMAWFDKEDKQVIGDISIEYTYLLNNKEFRDTLKSEIFLVK